jgi:hypothetical protein
MKQTQPGTAVILSSVHWNHVWCAPHSLAQVFSEAGYIVYFLEPWATTWRKNPRDIPRYLWNRFTGTPQVVQSLRQKQVPGIRQIPAAGFPDVGKLGESLNRHLVVPAYIARLKQHPMPTPVVFITFVPLPYGLEILQNLQPDFAFYVVNEFWEEIMREEGRQARVLEHQLCQQVDYVLADSPNQYARLLPYAKRIELMYTGCESHQFEVPTLPPAHPPERPSCTFFGNVGRNIDLELLVKISHHYPLHLIGMRSRPLPGLSPQTHIYPPVEVDEIPALLAHTHVLLLPYRTHAAHMRGVFPAKTFQYLATGKPIVMVGLEQVEQFEDLSELIYIARSHQEFLELIAIAGAEDDPHKRERRRAIARRYTPQANLDRIESLVWALS